MSTHNIQSLCSKSKDFPKLSLFASWTGAMNTLSGSNYPCLERISMVPKMFEPLRFDCNFPVRRAARRKKKKKKIEVLIQKLHSYEIWA